MKLLLATGIYPPDIGGPATYTKILKDELPGNGFEVKVLAYGEGGDGDGVFKISRNQNVLFRYFRYFLAVWKLSGWADVVYVQDPVSVGLPSGLACFLNRKKYILKIVGDYAWEQGRQRFGVKDSLDEFQDKKYSFFVEILRYIQRLAAKNAKLIITPSEYLKSVIKKWGVKKDNIRVVYNAVKKAERSQTDKAELKKGLSLEGYILLSAGRLVPWKGFPALVEIMPELLKENPEFKLIIIGEGTEANSLKNKIKYLGLEKNITLTGSLPQAKLWDYMRAADLFVLNTGYEGLPHITIEAMQLSLPIITTKSGGNTEVAEDGVSGLLVNYNIKEELKDAILRIYRDREYAGKLAHKAKEDVKSKFSKGLMVERISKILNENK